MATIKNGTRVWLSGKADGVVDGNRKSETGKLRRHSSSQKQKTGNLEQMM